MAGCARWVIAVAVLLGAYGFALAQPEIAPEPRLTLDEVVKEYQRLGLPVPDADVQIVRLRRYRPIPDDPEFKPDPLSTWLAFRNPPVRPGEAPRPRTGDEWMFIGSLVEDAVLRKPGRADLEHVVALDYEWLRFAVVFRLRGWDEAATFAYARALKSLNGSKPEEVESSLTALDTLRVFALLHWYRQLTERNSDRREVLKRLQELVRLERQFLTPELKWILEDLELTVAPRKSRPGTVEALIDELTDNWEDGFTGERHDVAYWKLAELGFDAVPALIEHLTDRRLTRSEFGGFNNFWPYTYRVNHLVSRLLVELSGGQLHNFEMRGDTLNPSEALKWWGKARELNEENWLLDHALPASKENSRVQPRAAILRAIRAKYPHRLREVYWAVLLKRTDVSSERIAAEIAASALPRQRKLALLEQGATVRDFSHSVPALKELARIDAAAFRKHYLRTVAELPAELPPQVRQDENEIDALGVVCESDDRECWDALLAATRRMTPGARLRVIDYIGWSLYAGRAAPGGREAVRYLLSFRDDTATAELEEEQQAVRDRAATALAFFWGTERPLVFDLPESPRERSRFRERMWALAEHELARPAK